MNSYEEVFKDYPYNKLLKSLSHGKVDLDTNSFETGQIYVFVRKKMYSNDESEDLSVVKKILPLQLKTIFSPPYDQKLPSNYGKLPNGSIISPLPISDTFLMSCYNVRATNLKLGLNALWESVSKPVNKTGTINLSYDDYNEKLNKIAYTVEFKYLTIADLKGTINRKERFNVEEILWEKIFKKGGEYVTGIKSVLEWAYVFKIPINPPIKQFINWTSNPFI
jgi:hypothetical protein